MRLYVFLFLLSYSNLSLALGLSDVELKSFLGENLNAQIDINDVDSALDVSCFAAKDLSEDGANRRFNIALKEGNSGYQLLISTRSTITEPIVNLRVSYVCEPNINREYVLLIDPPTSVSNLLNIHNPTANNLGSARAEAPTPKNPTAKNKSSFKQSSNVDDATQINNDNSFLANQSNPASASAPSDNAVKLETKKKRAKKKVVRSSVDDKLNEAYTGKATPSVPQNAAPATADNAKTDLNSPGSDKPYLVISGGSAEGGATNADNAQSGLVLRLETQIDFNRAEEAPLTTTDAMDEVTVMTNRLTHLEQQILSLQSKNAQLKAEAEKAKNEGFTLSPEQYRWLHHIGIILGIIALLAIAEALRRKILRHRLQRDESIWFVDNNEESADEDDALMGSAIKTSTKSRIDTSNIEATIFNEPSFGDNESTLNTNDKAANNLHEETNEDIESVLDHAEVFIAHGRPALAVQLLQHHLEELPAESPAIWLKLMNLLATEGTEEEYEKVVTECNQFFNIKMPKFADVGEKDNSTIEDHPHIVTRLEGVWGSQYALGFLNDLIYNQQSQPREGFERNTFEELFFLKLIAEKLQSAQFVDGVAKAYKPNMTQNTMQKMTGDSAMFSDVAPKQALYEKTEINDDKTIEFTETLQQESTDEVFFNVDGLSSGENLTGHHEIDMLLDIDDQLADDTFNDAKLSAPETLPALEDDVFETNEFKAEEIDFSVKEDEALAFENFEIQSTEIQNTEFGSMEAENIDAAADEITFSTESEVSKKPAKPSKKASTEKPSKKSDVEKVNPKPEDFSNKDDDANMIEFDLDPPDKDK